jgi:TDG/mug DNA glycosylase family protein
MSRPLPDRIRPGLRALFVGINPGLRSAAVGHHFAGHSNRFWKLLAASGLVPEPLTYAHDHRLPEWGFGLTNIIARPSSGVHLLTAEEYAAGRRKLVARIRRYQPAVVVLLGMSLYPILCPRGRARGSRPVRSVPRSVGLQAGRIAGVPVFLLPNPSGRNAHYSYQEMLAAYRGLQAYLLHPGAHSSHICAQEIVG